MTRNLFFVLSLTVTAWSLGDASAQPKLPSPVPPGAPVLTTPRPGQPACQMPSGPDHRNSVETWRKLIRAFSDDVFARSQELAALPLTQTERLNLMQTVASAEALAAELYDDAPEALARFLVGDEFSGQTYGQYMRENLGAVGSTVSNLELLRISAGAAAHVNPQDELCPPELEAGPDFFEQKSFVPVCRNGATGEYLCKLAQHTRLETPPVCGPAGSASPPTRWTAEAYYASSSWDELRGTGNCQAALREKREEVFEGYEKCFQCGLAYSCFGGVFPNIVRHDANAASIRQEQWNTCMFVDPRYAAEQGTRDLTRLQLYRSTVTGSPFCELVNNRWEVKNPFREEVVTEVTQEFGAPFCQNRTPPCWGEGSGTWFCPGVPPGYPAHNPPE